MKHLLHASSEHRPAFLMGLLVLVLSYFTYVHGYWNPPSLFWDENYHIASAQKYLNGVFFMELHPPLGKLMIAAGEYLLDRNPADDQFLDTDYARVLPDGFSFLGYRLFPTLFGWLTALLFYLFFLRITKHPQWSALLSFPYIFDNAQIVHARSAMLDSTMIFFAMGTVVAFAYLWDENRLLRFRQLSVLFGVCFGLLLATKMLGLIMVLLIPVLLWRFWPYTQRIGQFLLFGATSAAIVYVSVWQVHFALGQQVRAALPDSGFYQASPAYQAMVNAGMGGSLRAFSVELRDSLAYTVNYNKGVPRLDLCKSDENGSPFFLWPIGGRTINYRWETPDSNSYRYLYLVPNAVGWWLAFAAVLVTAGLLLAEYMLPVETPLKNRLFLLVFLGIYASFMIAISRIDRVMYLYHYLIPLNISYLVFGVLFASLPRIGSYKLTDAKRTHVLIGVAVCVFFSFQWFRPLTYYVPVTDDQVASMSLSKYWELTCVKCKKVSPLATPAGK